jgi:hypothetical protein
MKFKFIIIFFAFLLITACTSKTEYGDCVGAFDDKDASLKYRLSGLNVTLGIIFAELIIPPVLVIANETWCPAGLKNGS